MTWDAVVKLWYDEEKDFVYGGNTNDYMKIGHYTQVMPRCQNVTNRRRNPVGGGLHVGGA